MILSVALGLGLRGYHYFRLPSLWHDEAALVLNVIHKNYGEMFGPLLCWNPTPPLFLVLERAAADTMGDSLWSLRLLPFLVSCAGVLLMVPLTRRLLSPTAAPWAVFLFACSDRLLWHCCEAKPYALDVFLGVAFLALATAPWRSEWRLATLMLLAPVAIWASYPATFVCGGVLLALLPEIWAARSVHAWLLYVLLATIVLVAFATLALGPVSAQRCGPMDQCWEYAFPPYDRPWLIPWWLVRSTMNIADYCLKPLGSALLPLAILGGMAFWQRGQRPCLALLLIPTLLALVASLVHAYPYSGDRVLAYSTPAFTILVAGGTPVVLRWLRARHAWAAGAVLALLLTPLARAAFYVVRPWHRIDSSAAAAHVVQRLEEHDWIAGNLWDYEYHFREHQDRYLSPPDSSLPERLFLENPDGRLWLLISANDDAERHLFAAQLVPRSCQVLDSREFTGTTVLLVVPR